jgi:Uma2 family endonuclease
MPTAAVRAGMRLTIEELQALPDDGNRYELIDGVLFVTPAPNRSHQGILGELFLLIAPYAKQAGLDTYFAPVDVPFGDDTLVQPDLSVQPRLPDGRRALRFEDVGRLLLAVEVVSPSSRRTDRREKRQLYQREGVPVYWVVDGAAELVEVWTPGATAPVIEREQVQLTFPGASAPLVIHLPAIFRQHSAT